MASYNNIGKALGLAQPAVSRFGSQPDNIPHGLNLNDFLDLATGSDKTPGSSGDFAPQTSELKPS